MFMPSAKGAGGLNCFALLTHVNDLRFKTTTQKITSSFIIEQLEQLSFSIPKTTVLILDNVHVHTSKGIRERRTFEQQGGLHIVYPSPYSPHLNIAETLWHKLKYEWLRPADYSSSNTLFYTVQQALVAVGADLTILFSNFTLG